MPTASIDPTLNANANAKGKAFRLADFFSALLKYECVYLHAFERGSEAKAGIGKWLAYYNAEQPHSTHGVLTPNEAYDTKIEPMRLAA